MDYEKYDKEYQEQSPSSQRVWIEMDYEKYDKEYQEQSPSSQRVWIEITSSLLYVPLYKCRPLHRGCGLKFLTKF